MMKTRSGLLSLCAVLVLSAAIGFGCGGGGGDDDDDDDDDGVSPPPTCTPVLDTTLTGIQTSIFTPQCATANCHDAAGAPISNNLNLTAGMSHGEMVGVTALGEFNGATAILVVSSDAAASYLVKKINGTTGITGVRMPNDGFALCQEKKDAITAWIEAGAQDN